MKKYTSHILGFLLVVATAVNVSAQTGAFKAREHLLKSVSGKGMVETARERQWSIYDFEKRKADTVHVVAIRVDFQRDAVSLTTGDGRFGNEIWRDTAYKFDRMDHDSLYFAYQLEGVRNYYRKASRGKLTINFSVYPSGGGQIGYTVDSMMTDYSPGYKKKTETTDQYWDRKTHGLMSFVRDAVKKAATAADSPFRNLYTDGGTLRVKRADGSDKPGHKAAILILHAGASYLTDGGLSGSADSPSDMIDAFIDREFFKYFKDTLKLDTAGIRVTNGDGQTLTIDEVMMSAATSNQDGLNWGIQGVLVNQMARQLGIPDLFSRSSGVSAVGAFCIMDFAGYSAGQGFIPPYPSAWVRAFMGWDTPKIAGAGSSPRVKALTSVLDNTSNWDTDDTTILLVPINNNEYYLIENRQRNLSEDPSFFRYDLQEKPNVGIINAYPFNVNLERNIDELADPSGRRVITMARNNDVSLPASGVLVWHVDEKIIRQRLAYNFVNADSSYRGVRLVEADGINDLGVTFTDAFYQAAFDYGGAEDVFPHRTRAGGGKPEKYKFDMTPHTNPSTRSNDGGHTYFKMEFSHASADPNKELALNFQENVVENFSDEFFTVKITRDYVATGWPKQAAPEWSFHDPLVTEIAASSSSNNKDTVLAVLGKSGLLYLYSVNDSMNTGSYGPAANTTKTVDYRGDTISVRYFDKIQGAFTFPTAIGGKIFIPDSIQNVINVYSSIDINDTTTIQLPARPTSYVCGIETQTWAVGLVDGRVVIGSVNNDGSVGINNTVDVNASQSAKSPVRAVAALKDSSAAVSFAVIQDNGTLSVIRNTQITTYATVKYGIAPFTIVTGDLDNDGKSEIVVSDSRQGVWVYTRDLKLAQGWKDNPNDWANTYYIDPDNKKGDRQRYPQNFSAPALADLNRDGMLDIVISGTNGVYALNRKGALLSRWPAYLDNRYWYQRGSVTTSPVVAANSGQPLVLFASPTGERSTFNITKIESADIDKGVVRFKRDDGTLDSLWELSKATIDTILRLGDSLIYPYILPGGFVDALTPNASRPMEAIPGHSVQQSRWPLSIGAPAASSPVVYIKTNERTPDVFAVASDGSVYKWKLRGIDGTVMATDQHYWPQNGFDAARSFAYGGAVTNQTDIVKEKEPITFWNYPNPTVKGEPSTTFKYKFSGQATDVRLDIYTITGKRVDSFTMKHGLTGDYPDWNEFPVNLRKYGPGIYRCRMGATINRNKYSKYWKMAVVK